MNKVKFISFYKNNKDALTCYELISDGLTQAGIYSDNTFIGALATVRVECGRDFKPILEAASGLNYEGRIDLGNRLKGDGIKYKGRGYIQITGKANYDYYGKLIGVDLISNPDLALVPTNAAKILVQYFKDRKVNVACDKQDWVLARKLVNGGTNGLKDFLNIIKQYQS